MTTTRSRGVDFDVRGRDVPRSLFPRGRVKFALGVDPRTDRKGKEADRRLAQLEKLRTWGRQGDDRAWGILHALQRHSLEPGDVANRLARSGEAAVAELFREVQALTAERLPTLREQADRYLVWYGDNRKDRSLEQIRSRLKLFCDRPIRPPTPEEVEKEIPAPSVGGTPMDQLLSSHVEYALARWKRGNSRNAIHGAARGLFRWSLREEAGRARAAKEAPRWTVNPVAEVEKSESELREVTASVEQVLSLFAAAEPHQRVYLRAFVHLGLRLAELTHTRYHLDLDPETWVWRIQRRDPDSRCACPSCQGRGWSPKVKRSNRRFIVPAEPAELRATLTEYLADNPCEAGDFIFRDAAGRAWTEKGLRRDFRKLCIRAEVRHGRKAQGGIVVHDLRATCITRLLTAGVDLGRVAALVGDSADVLMDRYHRPTEKEIGEIISRGPRYSLGTPAEAR